MNLAALAAALREGVGMTLKRDIGRVADILPAVGHAAWGERGRDLTIRNGDDAAAIPDGDGHLLLAAEGMLPSFVARDPWFAGYCAVMVNVSDILAMGGRPYAVVDVLFTGDGPEGARVLAGMRDAARAFGVPVVGGHTSCRAGSETLLAAAIVGRARKLITSFDARPGHDLVLAVDLRGRYREPDDYFDAATGAPAARLRETLSVLPALAEAGLVGAGKDVSMAGIAGTLVMLCEGSGVGATLDLRALPRPAGVELARWLRTFPSCGFLLAVAPSERAAVHAQLAAAGLASAQVGHFHDSPEVVLTHGDARAPLWDVARERLTGFGRRT